MRLENIYVRGLGAYLPEWMSSRRAIEQGLYDEVLMLDSGVTGTLVADDTPPVDMAVAAARDALKRGGLEADSLGLLIYTSVVSQRPEMWYPAGYVLRELGAAGTSILEVRQGCNGMLAALELAAQRLTLDGESGAALLAAADNFNSLKADRWRGYGPGTVIGDAASAMLLDTSDGFAEVKSVNQLSIPELEGLHRGNEPLFGPADREVLDMVRRARHFSRTEIPLNEANQLIGQRQVDVVNRSLREAGIGVDQISKVIYVNQGKYLLAQFLLDPLGIPESKSSWDFGRTVGHLGASDHAVTLDHYMTTGQLRPGDHVLLAGAAPGFVVSSAVLSIREPASWAL
ncbi:MAG: ketoacyl-ACP synthase III family protein [Streptosporangiales bacterium]|jgi:3-oxoacyl-[acyl-carrier-protein] synthase-3|nr:ketoacyl-ACP synthase III family protein [Streptosporangiales bacterium]